MRREANLIGLIEPDNVRGDSCIRHNKTSTMPELILMNSSPVCFFFANYNFMW